jgi:hypothetical protein
MNRGTGRHSGLALHFPTFSSCVRTSILFAAGHFFEGSFTCD